MTSVQEKTVTSEQPVQSADPCVMVLFGAAGNLTKRLLIPALYNLVRSKLLPKEFAIVCFACSQMSNDDFRTKMSRDIQEFATSSVEPVPWGWIEQRLYYLSGNFDNAGSYQQLKDLLTEVNQKCGTQGNYLYYSLSTMAAVLVRSWDGTRSSALNLIAAATRLHHGNLWRR